MTKRASGTACRGLSMYGAAIIMAVFGLAGALPAMAQAAISGDVIRIGVMNDQSGVYADLAGPGSVEAVRLAVEEFGGTVSGKPVEVVSADHQNKPDIGAGIALRWFGEEGIDVIVDISNSSVGLAVVNLAKQKNRVVFLGTGSADFTGKACSPVSAQWVYNSYSNGFSLARTMTQQGLDTWYLLTVDYAFGHSFAADIRKAVEGAGGKVLGEVRHPLNTPDFASFLLQAQVSNAKVIALANAGADTANASKQAAEFGITDQQALAAPIVFVTDIHSMGLETARGLRFATAFYWDMNDETRAFSRRFFERRDAMPTMIQAGMYSAVRHYLRAVEAAGTDEAKAVMAKMREMSVDDVFSRGGRLREDGQMLHDMYLVEVKSPEESSGPWDYYKILATIPAEEAFRPLEQSECPLIRE